MNGLVVAFVSAKHDCTHTGMTAELDRTVRGSQMVDSLRFEESNDDEREFLFRCSTGSSVDC